MNEQKICIKQYEQAADEKVSLGGIRWERKWDVCVQCDSREEAERVRAALTMKHEPTTGNVLMDAYHAMQAKKEAAQPEQSPLDRMAENARDLGLDYEPVREPPQFPTMLRKMWSGGEVQKWINENWSKHGNR